MKNQFLVAAGLRQPIPSGEKSKSNGTWRCSTHSRLISLVKHASSYLSHSPFHPILSLSFSSLRESSSPPGDGDDADPPSSLSLCDGNHGGFDHGDSRVLRGSGPSSSWTSPWPDVETPSTTRRWVARSSPFYGAGAAAPPGCAPPPDSYLSPPGSAALHLASPSSTTVTRPPLPQPVMATPSSSAAATQSPARDHGHHHHSSDSASPRVTTTRGEAATVKTWIWVGAAMGTGWIWA
jgi:hypothetical protein